jgi:hypothetical protein
VAGTNNAGVSTNSNEVVVRPLPTVAPPMMLLGDDASFIVDEITGAQITVSNAMGGVKYRLGRCDNLKAPVWTWLSWQTCTNNGTGLMTLRDPEVPLPSQRFYRAQSQLP